ncbi:hypothetical protein POK33_37850 [Burkholderia cenocepacia]|uniref:hypothetical protein n=1 Tax=Burkholderia cenocepacia TaxID=95486 RepID=UPI0023BA3B71|nr:hypothetical protein [Burkholderia cenocepacia]MDF0506521.1 hypothetical protein [Burkholderia cenocepacia]
MPPAIELHQYEERDDESVRLAIYDVAAIDVPLAIVMSWTLSECVAAHQWTLDAQCGEAGACPEFITKHADPAWAAR